MNSKITMVKLSQLMAASSGRSQKQCEDFLRVLFQQIAAGLESGESVKIKGFGTFKLTDIESRKSVDVTTGEATRIPAHKRIVFVPSKELAAAVNAPFEMFQTVVLDERVLEEELMQAEATDNEVLVNSIQEQIMLDEEKETELEKEVEVTSANAVPEKVPGKEELSQEKAAAVKEESKEQLTDESADASTEESVEDSIEESTDEPTEEHVDEQVDETEPHELEKKIVVQKRKRGMRWWMYIAIALGLLLCGGVTLYFVNDDFNGMIAGIFGKHVVATEEDRGAADSTTLALVGEDNDMGEDISGVDGVVEDAGDEAVEDEKEDKEEAVPTTPSDAPVYDTVSTTRYLSTIAKEHYGNFNLWPYIYKENEKILGHPNRIKPGTKVVVPDLAKYGVDPKNKDDIRKAKKMGVEIYARWK